MPQPRPVKLSGSGHGDGAGRQESPPGADCLAPLATYAAETGFLLRREPDTVRAPDAAFVSGVRVEAAGTSAGYFPGAPDLAVEVISPSDTPSEVDRKVADWIGSGCRVVVVLDPGRRMATIHRPGAPVETLAAGDHLALPDLLPGWSVHLDDLYR